MAATDEDEDVAALLGDSILLFSSTVYIDEILRVTYAVETDEDEDEDVAVLNIEMHPIVSSTVSKCIDGIVRITYAVEPADNERKW